ncbi:hypothetical protein JZ751_024974 [Albula glossodonta]|uniref:Rho GTPase-activating protein 29/45 N-terminal domain-containing protein n=1 Tax=Albula glossodonta TaxID=121402 RepID=A0A8T2PEY3_9TELE|nr:hypothetical protein JZ751_024974 [Albula glossodonta]
MSNAACGWGQERAECSAQLETTPLVRAPVWVRWGQKPPPGKHNMNRLSVKRGWADAACDLPGLGVASRGLGEGVAGRVTVGCPFLWHWAGADARSPFTKPYGSPHTESLAFELDDLASPLPDTERRCDHVKQTREPWAQRLKPCELAASRLAALTYKEGAVPLGNGALTVAYCPCLWEKTLQRQEPSSFQAACNLLIPTLGCRWAAHCSEVGQAREEMPRGPCWPMDHLSTQKRMNDVKAFLSRALTLKTPKEKGSVDSDPGRCGFLGQLIFHPLYGGLGGEGDAVWDDMAWLLGHVSVVGSALQLLADNCRCHSCKGVENGLIQKELDVGGLMTTQHRRCTGGCPAPSPAALLQKANLLAVWMKTVAIEWRMTPDIPQGGCWQESAGKSVLVLAEYSPWFTELQKYSHDPYTQDCLHRLVHERLGELLRVLKAVIGKHQTLNSVDILSAAGTVIAKVKVGIPAQPRFSSMLLATVSVNEEQHSTMTWQKTRVRGKSSQLQDGHCEFPHGLRF